MIVDGDIPCTPEVEPSYSYVWNFCAKVTDDSLPQVCSSIHQAAAALQYLERADGYHECDVIGNYDDLRDDTHYKLINSNNPAVGVMVTYQFGDKCPSGLLRSATIDVHCDNVRSEIVSALEPNVCEYHMVMKSYHGCPVECPITKHGLCSSHGHCDYDNVAKAAYCFCNDGFYGDACDQVGQTASAGSSAWDGHSAQVTMLVILMLVALGLLAIVGYMVYRIQQDRKQQQANMYSGSAHGGEYELSRHDTYN
jgi:hypothetical protein